MLHLWGNGATGRAGVCLQPLGNGRRGNHKPRRSLAYNMKRAIAIKGIAPLLAAIPAR